MNRLIKRPQEYQENPLDRAARLARFLAENVGDSKVTYLAYLSNLFLLGWQFPPFVGFWACIFFLFWGSKNRVLARLAYLGILGLLTIFRVLAYYN